MILKSLIALSEIDDTMPAVEVKPPREFAQVEKLEAALDFGADPSSLRTLIKDATATLAGAADVASLASDGQVDGVSPQWAISIGLKVPLVTWLGSRVQSGSKTWIGEIPDVGTERQPGSKFVRFQNEVKGTLVKSGLRSAKKILGAFSELADNTREHSKSRIAPFYTFEVGGGRWQFSVTDLGMGVPNSLRTNPKFASYSDRDAVTAALQAGVSRHSSALNRGMGLAYVFRALAEHRCAVRLRTGKVGVCWTGEGVGLTKVACEVGSLRVGTHFRVAGELPT